MLFVGPLVNKKLDDWFAAHKATASEGQPEAGGERDPVYNVTLFTPETKNAVTNAKTTSHGLADKLPLDFIYREVTPPPNSKHQLPKYRSQRGERVETFHAVLANFANSAMSDESAGLLCLSGTSWYNVRRRSKVFAGGLSQEALRIIPWNQRGVPVHYNASNCAAINKMAAAAGADYVPHGSHEACELAADNGERFFEVYYHQQMERNGSLCRSAINDRCSCLECAANPTGIDGSCVDTKSVDFCVDMSDDDAENEELQVFEQEEQLMSPPTAMPLPSKIVPIIVKALTSWASTVLAPHPVSFTQQRQMFSGAAQRTFSAPENVGQQQPQVFQQPFVFLGGAVPQLQHLPGLQYPSVTHSSNFGHDASFSALQSRLQTRPSRERRKPQHEYCCREFMEYHTVTKKARGNCAGRAPHGQWCTPFSRK